MTTLRLGARLAAGRTLAPLGLAVLATACATPVGITRLDARAAHRTLTTSAISAGEPSAHAIQVLQRFGLRERFEDDPAGALGALHAMLGPRGNENRLFALAELSFLHAERGGGRPHYFAAAVYAYAFLSPEGAGEAPWGLDPRVRLAADLYNRSLTEALTREDGEVELAGGHAPLPFGELDIALDPGELVWAGRRLERFVPAAAIEVRGLRNRYRAAGVGAALAASLGPPAAGAVDPAYGRLPPALKVPVTAFLRLDGARQALLSGRVRGRLELFSKDAEPTVTVDGREAPVEYEPTAALAYSLERAPVWESELRGFLRGDDLRGLGGRLYTLTPYRPGRVPVVLVHGTASSPARWAELVNELDGDRRIAPRCQFWLFTYNTGNPLLYSAALLREALRGLVAELDPGERDPGLRRMILIGHSQGGLLVRLMVVDPGTRFWDNMSPLPFETLSVSPETRTLLRRSLFFEPLPFVERVVFLATPHRGSHVAGLLVRRLRGLLTWAVRLPPRLVQAAGEVATGSEDPILREVLRQGLPRSVDNMSPNNRAIQTLSSLPIAPGITAHSIIAVRGDGPAEEGSDGVVAYRSAHLAGAASERVVRSGHSVQSHPEALEEIRRILLEHLDGT